MSDRPDLINSELGGMSVAGTDQCFKQAYLKRMFAELAPLPVDYSHPFFVSVDPAAGGEKSDFAVISFWIHRGVYQVMCFFCIHHPLPTLYLVLFSRYFSTFRQNVTGISILDREQGTAWPRIGIYVIWLSYFWQKRPTFLSESCKSNLQNLTR